MEREPLLLLNSEDAPLDGVVAKKNTPISAQKRKADSEDYPSPTLSISTGLVTNSTSNANAPTKKPKLESRSSYELTESTSSQEISSTKQSIESQKDILPPLESKPNPSTVIVTKSVEPRPLDSFSMEEDGEGAVEATLVAYLKALKQKQNVDRVLSKSSTKATKATKVTKTTKTKTTKTTKTTKATGTRKRTLSASANSVKRTRQTIQKKRKKSHTSDEGTDEESQDATLGINRDKRNLQLNTTDILAAAAASRTRVSEIHQISTPNNISNSVNRRVNMNSRAVQVGNGPSSYEFVQNVMKESGTNRCLQNIQLSLTFDAVPDYFFDTATFPVSRLISGDVLPEYQHNMYFVVSYMVRYPEPQTSSSAPSTPSITSSSPSLSSSSSSLSSLSSSSSFASSPAFSSAPLSYSYNSTAYSSSIPIKSEKPYETDGLQSASSISISTSTSTFEKQPLPATQTPVSPPTPSSPPQPMSNIPPLIPASPISSSIPPLVPASPIRHSSSSSTASSTENSNGSFNTVNTQTSIPVSSRPCEHCERSCLHNNHPSLSPSGLTGNVVRYIEIENRKLNYLDSLSFGRSLYEKLPPSKAFIMKISLVSSSNSIIYEGTTKQITLLHDGLKDSPPQITLDVCFFPQKVVTVYMKNCRSKATISKRHKKGLLKNGSKWCRNAAACEAKGQCSCQAYPQRSIKKGIRKLKRLLERLPLAPDEVTRAAGELYSKLADTADEQIHKLPTYNCFLGERVARLELFMILKEYTESEYASFEIRSTFATIWKLMSQMLPGVQTDTTN